MIHYFTSLSTLYLINQQCSTWRLYKHTVVCFQHWRLISLKLVFILQSVTFPVYSGPLQNTSIYSLSNFLACFFLSQSIWTIAKSICSNIPSTSWSTSGSICNRGCVVTWFMWFEWVSLCCDDWGAEIVLIFNWYNLSYLTWTLTNSVTDFIWNTWPNKVFSWILISWLELLIIGIFIED